MSLKIIARPSKRLFGFGKNTISFLSIIIFVQISMIIMIITVMLFHFLGKQ